MQQNCIRFSLVPYLILFTRKFGWIVGIIKQVFRCSQIPAACSIHLSSGLHLCLALYDCRHACSSYPSWFQGKEVMVAVDLRSCCQMKRGYCFPISLEWAEYIKKFPYFSAPRKVNITAGSEIRPLTSVYPWLRVIHLCTRTASRAPNLCNLLSWKEPAIKAHQTPDTLRNQKDGEGKSRTKRELQSLAESLEAK